MLPSIDNIPKARQRLDAGVVLGRYVLIEQLGSGAMGVVYTAVDPELQRRIALKLLRTDRLPGINDSDRLVREARALARISHPNVVQIHDVGTADYEEVPRVFLAMEYVEGQDLRRWLSAGPHPPEEVIRVMVGAARGLAAAHAHGIVHRDFKPDNVLLGADGTPKVLDFGLAQQEPPTGKIDHENADIYGVRQPSRMTSPGMLLGTPAYMSPEQHRGETLDARSDQFSFCVLCFEGLYGERPFPGKTRHAIAAQTIRGDIAAPKNLRGVPAWIHAAILRGLHPDPAQRFPDMLSLIDAVTIDPQLRRRKRLRWGAAAALSVAGIAALLLRPDPIDLACGAEKLPAIWSVAVTEKLAVRTDPLAHALQAAHAALQADAGELCRTRAMTDAPSRLLDARETCIDRARLSLAAAAHLALERISGLEPTLDQETGVFDVAECDDLDYVVAAATAKVQDAQVIALARAELFLSRGLDRDAAREAELSMLPGGEAQLILGVVALREARSDDARDLLHRAALAGLDSAHPSLVSKAWERLAVLEAGAHRPEEARAWEHFSTSIRPHREGYPP